MKYRKLIVFAIISMFLFISPATAASFNLTSSTKQVSPNGTFTVSVGGDCIGRVNITVSNGTPSTSSVWVEQGYQTITVKAGSSGSVTVTASPVTGFSDPDANIYNPGSRSVTVNISSPSNPSTSQTKPTTQTKPPVQAPVKSSNNNLSSLTTSIGELSPKFNSDTNEYSLNLPGDITSIKIDATSSDSKAKINGLGDVSLKPGNNTINITVTAENGSTKDYKINVYVDDTPQITINYKGNKIGVIRNFEGVTIPQGFTENTKEIDNHTITLFTNKNITVIYGLNEKNEKYFYLYDDIRNECLSKFIPLSIGNHNLYIIDPTFKNNNLTLSTITISDEKIDCYKFGDNVDNYCLISSINTDGKALEYLYESTENTVQLYPSFLASSLEKSNNVIVYILSAFLLLSVCISAFLFYKLISGCNHEKSKYNIINSFYTFIFNIPS